MDTHRAGITGRRDEGPEDLLHFQSTSNIEGYQPDPYVLKQIVTQLKGFRQHAEKVPIPDDLINLVVHGIVDGVRRLDALPRDDPFWDQSNRRPTLNKLREFSNHVLRDEPRDVSALHTAIAFEILTYQNFDPRYWMKLHSAGHLDVSWPIYAALLLGADGFQAGNLLRFLKAAGLCDEAMTTLDRLMHSQERSISEWARSIIDGCGELSERGSA